jgi:ribose transport system substrate-binding protein
MKLLKICLSFAALSLTATSALADLVAYISPIGAQPGQQVISSGMEAGAKELGWDYTVLDANLSADKQVSHVDTLLNMKAKAFSTWSLDPNAVAGAFARAKDAGVPVIGLNSAGEGVTNTVWWATNVCTKGGAYDQQAAWIAKKQAGAKVVVVGGPPVPSIQANVKCFTEAAKAAGLDVIDQIDNTKDSQANAATIVADELLRHPDAQVFWTYNDSSALGVSAAVLAGGKRVYGATGTDGIMIFGLNADPDALTAIKEGRLTGTWDPNNFASGLAMILAIQTVLKDPAAAQTPLTVASTLVTFENLGQAGQGATTMTLKDVPLEK